MKVRGFRKGLLFGTCGWLILTLGLSYYMVYRHQAAPLSALQIIGDVFGALVVGTLCGLLAMVMRRFGRGND